MLYIIDWEYAEYAVYAKYAVYAEYVNTLFHMRWYASDMQKKKYEPSPFDMHLYAKYAPI